MGTVEQAAIRNTKNSIIPRLIIVFCFGEELFALKIIFEFLNEFLEETYCHNFAFKRFLSKFLSNLDEI